MAQRKPTLDDLIRQYEETDRVIKAEQDVKDELSRKIIELMKENGFETLKVPGSEDGPTIQATLVEGERTWLVEDRLRTKLGAARWRKLLSPVLDRQKLDAAIKSGDIAPTDVASCMDSAPNKPYIRITRK